MMLVRFNDGLLRWTCLLQMIVVCRRPEMIGCGCCGDGGCGGLRQKRAGEARDYVGEIEWCLV